MRIISKFADVYDLQNTMFDTTRTWIRNTENTTISLEKDRNFVLEKPLYRLTSDRSLVTGGVYTIFPMFIFGEVHWLHTITNLGQVLLRTFNSSKVEPYLIEQGLQLTFRDGMLAKNLQKTFASINEQSASVLNKLIDLRVPLAIVTDAAISDTGLELTIETNPSLIGRNIPWQEIEPNLYKLHQLMESYIFGVLGTGEPTTVSLTDKDRIIANGFDYKTSFRNMK